MAMVQDQVNARKEYVMRARDAFREQEQREHTQTAPAAASAGERTPALRLVVSLLLFLLFVLADVTDSRIGSYSTKELAEVIAVKEDYTNLEKYVMMLFTDQ